mgnify:CR=1 FL=1
MEKCFHRNTDAAFHLYRLETSIFSFHKFLGSSVFLSSNCMLQWIQHKSITKFVFMASFAVQTNSFCLIFKCKIKAELINLKLELEIGANKNWPETTKVNSRTYLLLIKAAVVFAIVNKIRHHWLMRGMLSFVPKWKRFVKREEMIGSPCLVKCNITVQTVSR